MSGPAAPAVPGGPDAIATASVFGAISGALSVLFPYFDGLTVALSALLIVLRFTRRSWEGTETPPFRGPLGLAVACLGVGWGFFLLAPPLVAELRGCALGCAGLPIWWWFRRGSAVGR